MGHPFSWECGLVGECGFVGTWSMGDVRSGKGEMFLMRYPGAECCGGVRAGLYSGGNGDSSAALLRATRR